MCHITTWEEDYKGNNTFPSLQSPLANSSSPSCTNGPFNLLFSNSFFRDASQSNIHRRPIIVCYRTYTTEIVSWNKLRNKLKLNNSTFDIQLYLSDCWRESVRYTERCFLTRLISMLIGGISFRDKEIRDRIWQLASQHASWRTLYFDVPYTSSRCPLQTPCQFIFNCLATQDLLTIDLGLKTGLQFLSLR
jgi:hypothetical protein